MLIPILIFKFFITVINSIIYGFSTVLGLLLFSIAVSNADENQHQVYCEQSVKGEEVCESR